MIEQTLGTGKQAQKAADSLLGKMEKAPNSTMRDAVKQVYLSYPPQMREALYSLRQLIFDQARSIDVALEETLKWGEPAYLSARGSTIRLAWQAKTPERYRMLFICSTTLVDTFRQLYTDSLAFEKNRAMVFTLDQLYESAEVAHCVSLALRYRDIKHLPNLGM